ncbi:MAG: hypothetical protein KGD63_05910 [Candidatus Lokiarchaeota archaeon]|nr:hypothetical protein [Candidatus Lokiarchaeota archaeon]
MAKNKKGTYEWVSKTFNIQEGCIYNCQYPCYARLIRRKKQEDWINPIFKEAWFNQKIFNYTPGFLANCMCFSSHDIYPENQENCLKFILRIINESDNTVLITTKGNIDVIKYLCENLAEFKERVNFMITITSKHDSLAVKYEPEAPLISERLLCLEYLDYHKWRFNVSVEPFLDQNPLYLIENIFKHYRSVNSIWLGCNSRKNYYFYTLKNLELIQEYIDKFPKEFRSKIFLKNSFIDKLEKLREKLKHHYKTLNRF